MWWSFLNIFWSGSLGQCSIIKIRCSNTHSTRKSLVWEQARWHVLHLIVGDLKFIIIKIVINLLSMEVKEYFRAIFIISTKLSFCESHHTITDHFVIQNIFSKLFFSEVSDRDGINLTVDAICLHKLSNLHKPTVNLGALSEILKYYL